MLESGIYLTIDRGRRDGKLRLSVDEIGDDGKPVEGNLLAGPELDGQTQITQLVHRLTAADVKVLRAYLAKVKKYED